MHFFSSFSFVPAIFCLFPCRFVVFKWREKSRHVRRRGFQNQCSENRVNIGRNEERKKK